MKISAGLRGTAGWMRLGALILVMGALGCANYAPTPEKTQLEIRQIQTHSYPAKPGQFKRIMKAVIDVLQDEGYLVRNADHELGFITASREEDVGSQWDMAFSVLASGSQGRYSKNKIHEASVNISERGPEVRVRAIFQTKVLDNMGGTVAVKQIDSPPFYQDFFAKVDKGIFLEKQNL